MGMFMLGLEAGPSQSDMQFPSLLPPPGRRWEQLLRLRCHSISSNLCFLLASSSHQPCFPNSLDLNPSPALDSWSHTIT